MIKNQNKFNYELKSADVANFITDAIEEEKLDTIPQDCAKIVELAKRAEGLVDTLYHYSQVGQKEKALAIAPLHMSEILSSTLTNLDSIIREHKAAITYDALPDNVLGDEAMLIQLLQNLIGNSIKYCDEPIPTIHVSVEELTDEWKFSVKDNGIGIAKESRTIIFKPFQRLHKPGAYFGSGLGLTTCKKIIDRHGGQIWCEDVPDGQGTIFYFTLPKEVCHAQPTAEAIAC